MSEIEYSVKDHIATILLNRPEKLNTFTPSMLKRWKECLVEAQDDPDVRVVILTGAGKGFCAGGDMSKRANEAQLDDAPRSAIERKQGLRNGPQSIAKAALALEKPYIAAVNGAAVGAGMDMALMCDMRIVGRSARFSEAYLRVGLVPGAGGCYFLPRVVGLAKALELFFTGDFVTADEAVRIGLANRVVDDDKLMEETYALARRIVASPPIACSLIKRTIYQSVDCDLRTSLDLISSHMAIVQQTEDSKEAIASFKEKRPGVFKGR